MWGVSWITENRIDGRRELMLGTTETASPSGKGVKLLFPTRQMARDYIDERWGYIRNRPDLQREPHGWRIPTAKRVKVVFDD